MNVLISGGTGLIGKAVQKYLRENGHQVRILSRKRFDDYFYWNIDKKEIDQRAFENLDAIIHLSGESIAQRWTKSVKKRLYSSRIEAANLLFEYSKEFAPNLKCFISASGINYYGTVTQSKPFTEEDLAGNDYLAKLCMDWEKAAFQFEQLGTRVTCLRTGIVISEKGGALGKIIPISKLGLNAPIGTGKQFMPWVSVEDLARMYVKCLEDESIYGSYNAVTSEKITNKEFTQLINQYLGKKTFMPNVPSFVLKLIYGEMANILLEGSLISNQKIKEKGLVFENEVLEDLFLKMS